MICIRTYVHMNVCIFVFIRRLGHYETKTKKILSPNLRKPYEDAEILADI